MREDLKPQAPARHRYCLGGETGEVYHGSGAQAMMLCCLDILVTCSAIVASVGAECVMQFGPRKRHVTPAVCNVGVQMQGTSDSIHPFYRTMSSNDLPLPYGWVKEHDPNSDHHFYVRFFNLLGDL